MSGSKGNIKSVVLCFDRRALRKTLSGYLDKPVRKCDVDKAIENIVKEAGRYTDPNDFGYWSRITEDIQDDIEY